MSLISQRSTLPRSFSYPIRITNNALSLRSAYAQVTGATLSGTVTDPSGGVVPNTSISIKNEGTGLTPAVKTDTAGFYSATLAVV